MYSLSMDKEAKDINYRKVPPFTSTLKFCPHVEVAVVFIVLNKYTLGHGKRAVVRKYWPFSNCLRSNLRHNKYLSILFLSAVFSNLVLFIDTINKPLLIYLLKT